eukprot:763252-Hanusia_phi.AAC.2
MLYPGDSVRKIKNIDAGEVGVVQEVIKNDDVVKVTVQSKGGKVWKLQNEKNYEKIEDVVVVQDIPHWNQTPKTMNLAYPIEFEQYLREGKVFDAQERKALELSWSKTKFRVQPTRPCQVDDAKKRCWEAESRASEIGNDGPPIKFYPRFVRGGDWIPSWFHRLFKVDMWGNLISIGAVQGSLCVVAVDHLFPRNRGGRTEPKNLMIIQSIANKKKGDKILPFLSQEERDALSCGLQEAQFLSITKHVKDMFGCEEKNFAKLHDLLTKPLVLESSDWEKLPIWREGEDCFSSSPVRQLVSDLLQTVSPWVTGRDRDPRQRRCRPPGPAALHRPGTARYGPIARLPLWVMLPAAQFWPPPTRLSRSARSTVRPSSNSARDFFIIRRVTNSGFGP